VLPFKFKITSTKKYFVLTVFSYAYKNRAGSGGRGESEIIPALLNALKYILSSLY